MPFSVHRLEFKKFVSVGHFQASLITICLAQLTEGIFSVGDINTSSRTGKDNRSYALIFFFPERIIKAVQRFTQVV